MHDLALYLVVLMYYVLELSYEVALFDLESIVCIATVYIDLQIHYITSFCILYIHTFLCIFVRIYIPRASYSRLTYLTYPSKNNNGVNRTFLTIHTSILHDQYRITRRIYESCFDRKSTTAKQPVP